CPEVFLSMTGLRVREFDQSLHNLEPRYEEAEHKRLQRPDRLRAIGSGPHMKLSIQNQLLLTVIWLRLDPTYQTLGFLFGVSDTTAGRVIQRRMWNSTAKWRVCACRWSTASTGCDAIRR
ncbi:MAG: helix-turn-helix domain-containing protein, partial [Anaerolineae bacterium]